MCLEKLRLKMSCLQNSCVAADFTNDHQTEALRSQVIELTAEMRCLTVMINEGTSLDCLLASRDSIATLHGCTAIVSVESLNLLIPECRRCRWHAFCS